MMSDVAPLRYGLFTMPIHPPEKSLSQCIDEDIELAVTCDELGFHDFWVGEHHSSGLENIIMPEIFLARVLAETKTLRVGPAPVCLQYHHPVHVAGRLAFLDHLSKGRLNVCFGPGSIPTDMELFGIKREEVGPRVVESIDMILKLWTSDGPVDLQGEFWNIRLDEQSIMPQFGLGVRPRPLQQPHPPICVPVIGRGSAGLQAAAARGFGLFSHHMIHADVLADQWKSYAEGAAAAGRQACSSDWSVSRNIFVADTTDEARKLIRVNSLGGCIRYILDLSEEIAPQGAAMWKRSPEQDDADFNMEYFMNDVAIAGDPEEVTRQLLELREQVGPFGTIVPVGHDWDDRDRWKRSLELFAREVVPRFNQAIGAA